MKIALALLLLCLSGCSHAPAESERVKTSDAEIAVLAKPEAQLRLNDIQQRLAQLEERLSVTRARRDNSQMQAATDVTKQNAVDGTEAEISTIQQKRAALLHEEHALEARLRELEN